MPLRGYKTKTCDVFIVVVHSSTGKHDVTFGLDCNQQLRPKNKNDQQPVVTFKNVSQVDRLVRSGCKFSWMSEHWHIDTASFGQCNIYIVAIHSAFIPLMMNTILLADVPPPIMYETRDLIWGDIFDLRRSQYCWFIISCYWQNNEKLQKRSKFCKFGKCLAGRRRLYIVSDLVTN